MSARQPDEVTEVAANGALSYESIIDAVRKWPLPMRIVLMHDLLNTLTQQEDHHERRREAISKLYGLLKPNKLTPSGEGDEPYGPKRNTVDDALGLISTDEPAPSDEDVERWLGEHRMEKYG